MTETCPEPCRWTAREAVRRLHSGEVTPTDLLEAALTRMDQVAPQINAVVIRQDDRARAAAQEIAGRSQKGLLAGLPIGVKDLIPVAGMRATMGSPALADFVPDTTEPLIARLEAHCAIVAGKTNTPEFGAGGSTSNAVFGVTRNPWNTGRNAGGSSGGAAAALAAGEVWLSHGSDLAGSIRTPAALCGVVGLRPSPGRCGGAPADTAFALEAVQGPMARDVRDLALFLDAMVGFEPQHPLSLEPPTESFQSALDRSPGPIRVAFAVDQGGFAPVEAAIRDTLSQAMTTISGEGMTVEAACPDLPGLYDTYCTLRGLHYAAVVARLPSEIQQHFKPTLRRNVDQGLALSAAQLVDAHRHRSHLYQTMRAFLSGYDVLAIPVVGVPPGPVEEEYPAMVDGVPVDDYVDWLRFSMLSVVTTLPSLSLPAGFTKDGLPVGVQLIGPPRGEARLLQVALAMEDRLGLPLGPIDPRSPH